MSTLPGLASKGEKGKSKFQSLDINSLYRGTLGESVEKQQQKNTLTHKHGMQILGRVVPNTRRPPANLPSLKSEHSGTDTAVSLVPSNGSGWGKQESTSSSTTTSTTSVSNSSTSVINTSVTPQLSAHQAAIALPVTTTIPPPSTKPHSNSATPATGDKSWSSVMSGNDPTAHPPPYQSPQFQHEFPSLSAGDGVPSRTGTDTQYGPGPSLRPQTEGSWLQGGSRVEGAVQRSNSVPHNVPPQLSAPGGPPVAPQYRAFVPPFMLRGSNFQTNGHGGSISNIPGQPQVQPSLNRSTGGNNVTSNRNDQNRAGSRDHDELAHRPIIKEEELHGMDNLTSDMGWAMHDDIDYNQKLAFSDDESKPDKDRRKPRAKEYEKTDNIHQEHDHKSWVTGRTPTLSTQQQQQQPPQSQQQPIPRSRLEDEELQRRKQQQTKAIAVERAKQRKDEEEKKYEKTKQEAAKKLKELDEKIDKRKRDNKECDETSGTIHPASVPAQTVTTVPIPLPEWERDEKSKLLTMSQEPIEDSKLPTTKSTISHVEHSQSNFRQLTQIDGRNTFTRKDGRGPEKDQASHNFSRQFQIPPRFQKQMNSTSQSNGPFQYDTRWNQGSNNKTSPNNRKNRDLDNKERDDDRYRRHQADDYRGHRTYSESGRKSSSDNRYDDYRSDLDFKKDKEDDKKGRHENKLDSVDNLSRQNSDEWHGDRRIDRYGDRPPRPDSRDSRTSRESRHSGDSTRHSEPRDYIGAWPETHFEDGYEEKKKEHRMPQVPGPITKEKIEADDLRIEKRNLTQLKRGAIPDKKLDKREDLNVEKSEGDDPWNVKRNKEDIDSSRGAWADAISPSATPLDNSKFIEVEKKSEYIKGEELDEKKEKDEKRSNRGRSDSQGSRNQGWGGSNNSVVYRSSSSWSKKGAGGISGRGSRGSVSSRPPSSKSGEWHGTESESSADDGSMMSENTLHKSPKAIKKFDKDEKNKELKNDKPVITEKKGEKPHRDFVPRGEPSRHGRGGASGGSSFRGGRGGCKRIDGYGPPPVKSPFSSYHEEKDKKVDTESTEINADEKCRSKDIKMDDRNKKKDRRKPKVEGEISDNSDDASKDKRKVTPKPIHRQPTNQQRRNNPIQTSRIINDKRTNFGGPSRNDPPNRQNSSNSLRLSQNKDSLKEKDALCNAISDVTLKNREESDNIDVEIETPPSDDGFQEVKSKKAEKRPKPEDKACSKPQIQKVDKDVKSKPKPTAQLSQQQIANIPSLMAMPINPPVNLPQPQQNKTQFERPRQNKLPPRLVKQRENNRLHKAQLQQGICEVNDINKVSQNMFMKDNGQVASSITNAWEKPLAPLRGNVESSDAMSISIDTSKVIEQQVNSGVTNEDKVLDGSTPLNTIIFENSTIKNNTYKSAPGPRGRNDKARPESMIDGSTLTTFNKPIGELLNKNDKQADIQMDLTFGTKEDNADMKLDFFESEISHLTEEKSTNKNISGLPRTMHAITTSNSTISPSTADALNIKIQSVKKVWEMTPVIENSEDTASFPTSFGPDPNSLDPSAVFNKPSDSQDDNHEGYSPSPSNQNASNSTTNVCKVKPTQQVAGSAGQTVLSAGTHQQHSAMVGPGLMGHTLSPPPQMPVIGGGVGLGQPPQQYTTNQHINYQAGLGGSTQYGMSAIPSPPTVLYNPNQQLQAAQSGLYGAFQIDQSQVLSNQGRSQYSQYSQYGLGQTASSPYSGQSVYLQPAQPHPPPTQAPPDIYTSNYRLPATGPFGQSQQLSNPTTVLISSTSNSLMSATVKPSSQQISAIGTKAGGVGQAYQQQTQQGQQLYMAYDPTLQANYLQNTGVMQRGPNSVMPGLQPSALQPSSSYYSGSTGGQTAGYFQQPGSSTLQSAQMSQHQAGYGLQGNVFGTHNQSHTSGMQNFGSHFLSGQLQLAAMSQQFRSANTYMKSVGNQQMNDQSGRSQQLKSPGGQQEVLSSVFNSASQIPSPKSRPACKQPPPQPSPTSQNKYLYQNVQNQQQSGQNRYPAPIQRPIGNPYPLGASMPNTGNQKHRANNVNNRAAPRQYYGGQGGNLNNQGDKSDESKLGENVPNSTNNSSSAKTAVTSVNQSTDKGDIGKDENCAISKD